MPEITQEEIEEGEISRGRVLYRESVAPNPKDIENIRGDAIITSYATTDRLKRNSMRKIHRYHISSLEEGNVIFPNAGGVPRNFGKAITGVYSVNRGFLGVFNMYKVATLVSEDYEYPKWFRDHLNGILEQAEGKFVELPEPITQELVNR